MLTLQLNTTFTDSTLPYAIGDPLLVGANSGVRFLFDISSVLSWATQGTPSTGNSVLDIGAVGNGTIVIGAGSVSLSGGGFDFSLATGTLNSVKAPTNTLTPFSTVNNQYFLVCGYFKLPSAANWNSTGTIYTMMQSAATTYPSGADLITIAQNTSGILAFRRQTNGGSTVDSSTITLNAGLFGTVVQIAAWINATGQGFRIRNASVVQKNTAAVGTANTGDVTATQYQWGPVNGFAATLTGQNTGLKVYRGFIEDLTTSGRNPETVLDADWIQASPRFS